MLSPDSLRFPAGAVGTRLGACFLGCALWLGSGACNAEAASPESVEFRHDGLVRTYLIARPADRAPRALPVVVLLHGGTQNAARAWRQTRLPQIAQRERFLLVAPNAMDGTWNDGRSVHLSGVNPRDVDDVGFIVALVAHLVDTGLADASRVYVTGASNGGFMTWRLACERGELVAAIAPVIATMPLDADGQCASAPALPVLSIFGTLDPLVPYDGSPTRTRTGEMTERRLSARQSTDWWASHSGCSSPPRSESLPDKAPGDGSTVVRTSYEGCREGAEVVRMDVVGGGHTWPGSSRRGWLRKRFLGPTNRDIDAAEEIWSFFQRHRRR